MAAWPTKEITIIVPYVPGGNADFHSREVAMYIEKEIKTPVVVKYMPGADGLVAQNYLTQLDKNDNHTFMFNTESIMIASVNKGGGDHRNLTATNVFMKYPSLLIGGPNTSVDNFKKQIADGKTINVAVLGLNGIHVIWASQLSGTNLKFNFIPYKGLGQIIPDLLSGTVEYVLTTVSPMMTNLEKEGKVHPIMSSVTNENLNVSGFRQFGFKGTSMEGFLGFSTRRDTSEEAVQKFSELVRKNTNSNPKIQELSLQGMNVINLYDKDAEKYVTKYLELLEKDKK
jgi:tripartite-type tricarboxylate transporter receptor subunit TctC